MRDRFSSSLTLPAIALLVGTVSMTALSAQAPSLKTPWGEPDLQGIWTDESDTPLQRSPKFANQETFTEAQRAELDRERSALMRRDKRVERGTELDVAGAYNAVFTSQKRTGARTSLIIDPPNGRIPPMTPEAQKLAAADRDYRLALLQSTDTCKNKSVACAGGKYDPTPSPRRSEPPPRYNTVRINRHDGPEDGALPDRCLTLGLPEFGAATGSFRRIVQTPGGISIFTTSGRVRAGSATSSWMGGRICRPVSANGTAIRAGVGRATPSSLTSPTSVRRPTIRARAKIFTWSSAGGASARTASNTS